MKTVRDIFDEPLTPDEDGYVTIVFSITDYDISDETVRFICQRKVGGLLIGFDFVSKRQYDWGVRIGDKIELNPEGWIEEGVTLVSRGEETENFARLLAQLYELKPQKIIGNGKPNVLLSGYVFRPEPTDVSAGFTEMKLAYDARNLDDDYDAGYWQAFTRFDLTEGLLQLEEKDQDYRQAQINTLFNSWKIEG